jgi:predicted GH43/DUF377 family glycosyl hydrolase
VPNVIFSCGSAVLNNRLFVYYGGADSVLCVTTENMDEMLSPIRK